MKRLGHIAKVLTRNTARPAATRLYAAIALLASAVVVVGCWQDAEHLNPLDPLSPEYQHAGRIEGQILSRGFNPIGGLTVTAASHGGSASGGSALTQPDGSFSFDGLPPGTFVVTITGDGYTAVVDTVEVTVGQTTPVSHTINAIPVLLDQSLRTAHVSRWWPEEDLYRLDVEASVDDPDGLVDVASVTFVIPHIAFESAVIPTPEAGIFTASINQVDLPGTTVHELLGREMRIRLSDQTGATAEYGSLYLSRVIDYIPEPLSPSGSQEVPGGMPQLTWLQADLPFDFTYQVDVYRMDDQVSTVVYTAPDISSSATTHAVTTTLITGQHYWTLSVIDEFGNRSRSREAGFIVP